MDAENLKLLAKLKNAATDAIQIGHISVTVDDDIKVKAVGSDAKWLASGMLLVIKAFEIQEGICNDD